MDFQTFNFDISKIKSNLDSINPVKEKILYLEWLLNEIRFNIKAFKQFSETLETNLKKVEEDIEISLDKEYYKTHGNHRSLGEKLLSLNNLFELPKLVKDMTLPYESVYLQTSVSEFIDRIYDENNPYSNIVRDLLIKYLEENIASKQKGYRYIIHFMILDWNKQIDANDDNKIEGSIIEFSFNLFQRFQNNEPLNSAEPIVLKQFVQKTLIYFINKSTSDLEHINTYLDNLNDYKSRSADIEKKLSPVLPKTLNGNEPLFESYGKNLLDWENTCFVRFLGWIGANGERLNTTYIGDMYILYPNQIGLFTKSKAIELGRDFNKLDEPKQFELITDPDFINRLKNSVLEIKKNQDSNISDFEKLLKTPKTEPILDVQLETPTLQHPQWNPNGDFSKIIIEKKEIKPTNDQQEFLKYCRDHLVEEKSFNIGDLKEHVTGINNHAGFYNLWHDSHPNGDILRNVLFTKIKKNIWKCRKLWQYYKTK